MDVFKVIDAENVNDAYRQGLDYLLCEGERRSSRVGDVLVSPVPVVTVYQRPMERVLFAPVRDANPFFHLFEALWMLAGRNDATWLDFFVKDFSSRFAEEGIQHGAYGYRWRHAFGFDQLDAVVEKLKKNPDDRQAVIQMWDARWRLAGRENEYNCGENDLLGSWFDKPCNTHIYLRIVTTSDEVPVVHGYTQQKLDITVCCRSNDIVWGAYGANAVHFSVLQEYLAKRIGVGVGTYFQFSNNYHVYTSISNKLPVECVDKYADGAIVYPIVGVPETFDKELDVFLREDFDNKAVALLRDYSNPFLPIVAWPMAQAYRCWREKQFEEAKQWLTPIPERCDWRIAAESWLQRRMLKVKVA